MPKDTKKKKKATRKPTTNKLSGEEKRCLSNLSSLVSQRAALFSKLGESYEGKRDVYAALGYKKNLVYDDYYAMWAREGIGKRVVKAFPEASWRGIPEITIPDKKDKASMFLTEWKSLVKKIRIWHYLKKIDILSGIGQFGVLFIGFSDGKALKEPVSKLADSASTLTVNYLQAYPQGKVEILEVESNHKDPRFGQPTKYSITLQSNLSNQSTHDSVATEVHWSRVIHVAEEKEDSEVYGTPRLESVFNYVKNIEKVGGGDAEMFWLGAYQGLFFNVDKDVEITNTDDLNDEVEEFVHGMKRHGVFQGVEVKSVAPAIAQVWEHLKAPLTLISGAKGIPTRILTGSERGELASVMDENNWNTRVDERRTDFAEVDILRTFIDRLVLFGVLVPSEYEINWPALEADDAKRKSEIEKLKTESYSLYVTSGLHELMPFEMYLRVVMSYTEAQVQELQVTYGDFALTDDDEDDMDDEENDEPTE